MNPVIDPDDLDDDELDRMLQQSVMNQSRVSKRSTRSNFSKKGPKRPLTFAEMREQERIAEASKVGPGSVDPYKPIGAGMNKVSFGSKYEFKPDKNPAPG